ncbi:MAG: type II secretion system F family protein [Planctomycetota bacterium]|jgi:type IV pilus assembly protein PilC
MTVSATKVTDELDSEKKGHDLPQTSNKQGEDRNGSGTFNNAGIDSSSATQIDNDPVQAQAKLPVRLQLHRSKVKQAELILFTTQLSVMLDSGVVLSDALDAIAEQAEYGTFKMVIMDVAETVKNGDNFSRALSEYPKIFNRMFISMVKASEASGRMAEMLNVLSGYLNFESETRKRIKGALTYPFIMALMAVAATGTLMFFVLPRFMRIYESKGASLPKITKVVVGFSRFIGDFQSMTIFLTGLILMSVGLYYWSGTITGRRVIDFIKIRTPVLGTMFIDTTVTRSMRIMATMLNTGVNLLDSIVVIQGSCDNYYFTRLWAGVNEKIRDGYQLSESINGAGNYPNAQSRRKKR